MAREKKLKQPVGRNPVAFYLLAVICAFAGGVILVSANDVAGAMFLGASIAFIISAWMVRPSPDG